MSMQIASHPYTNMVYESEVNILRCLHGMLENDPATTREQFLDLMKAAFENGKLDARALSDDLGFSASTVYRWIEGRSAPHQSLWPTVTEWIMHAIQLKISFYASEMEQVSTVAN